MFEAWSAQNPSSGRQDVFWVVSLGFASYKDFITAMSDPLSEAVLISHSCMTLTMQLP